MRATAFCPGHITGLFFPCPHQEALASGSRGAGMCVDRGATSTVSLADEEEGVRIAINGKVGTAAVTRAALLDLLPAGRGASVDTALDLPMGSGFGMSAAGALSAAVALADLLGLPRQRAFEAAHRAELACRSGLGDVAGLTAGGIEIRVREGLPPHGEVVRLADELELVAGVVGPRMSTAEVLEAEGMRRMAAIGEECHRRLLARPSVDRYLELCRGFAERSGIITTAVRRALDALDGLGRSSMVMLGNTVFAVGALDEQEAVLRRFGPTYRLRLDVDGPRVIRRE